MRHERIPAAATVLLGRTSYEGFSSYWPGLADAPADPANRALSEDNREPSRIYNRLPKVVVSDSHTPPPKTPVGHHHRRTPGRCTRLAGRRAPGAVAATSSRTAAGPCGARFWRGSRRRAAPHGGPMALGGGTPLFVAPAEFSLLEVRRFDGSDNVLLRYGVSGR